MQALSKAVASFAATVGVVALVLVAAVPANAATIQFQDGLTFENQAIFSSSASKVGATSTDVCHPRDFIHRHSRFRRSLGFLERHNQSREGERSELLSMELVSGPRQRFIHPTRLQIFLLN